MPLCFSSNQLLLPPVVALRPISQFPEKKGTSLVGANTACANMGGWAATLGTSPSVRHTAITSKGGFFEERFFSACEFGEILANASRHLPGDRLWLGHTITTTRGGNEPRLADEPGGGAKNTSQRRVWIHLPHGAMRAMAMGWGGEAIFGVQNFFGTLPIFF